MKTSDPRPKPSLFATINAGIDSRTGKGCLLLGLATLYLVAYFSHRALPGNDPARPVGWAGYWDQSHYIDSAGALAFGRLSKETYWYPLGYPLLGAPFYRWLPQHPFLWPNLACVLGIGATFYQIAKRVVAPLEAILLMLVFIAFYRDLTISSLVIPWNTIPTHFLAYSVVLLIGLATPVPGRILAATFCVGLIYLCRPGDAACMALIPAIAICRLPSWTARFRVGAIALAVLLLFHGAVLLVNQAVFGDWSTPYQKVVADIGFGSFPILPKLFLMFVDGRPLFEQRDSALLLRFPWLVLAIPGALCILRRQGIASLGLLLGIAATWVIYLSYNDLWPGNIFIYLLFHYLFWTLPLLALLAYLSLKEAWRFRGGGWLLATSVVLPFAICWFVTLSPSTTGRLQADSSTAIPATPAAPVDWIFFPGVQKAPLLAQGSQDFRRFVHYIRPKRSDGEMLFLASRARQKPITVSPDGPPNAGVMFGLLNWRFQLAPPEVMIAIQDLFAPPQIVLRGKMLGIDVTGRTTVPDGAPDEVIEVTMRASRLREIETWELVGSQKRLHWTSSIDPQWWPIKVMPISRGDSGLLTVRLCFPDFGQLESVPWATLLAKDDRGRELLRTQIHGGPNSGTAIRRSPDTLGNDSPTH